MCGIAQQGGGVEGCRHVDVAFFEKLSVLACDFEIGFDDAHGGDAAEAYDDLRTQQGGLIAQPVHAGFLFLLQGIAVLRRAAFDDICNVDIRAAVEVDGGEVFIEQLTACTPTNGSPCKSSFRPGPSPMNMTFARGLPTPNTTLERTSQVALI